jgi:ubiquinone/menaquinone biosynthesis C-methylase UbiE
MVHANFMNMSFADNTFDDVYAIDASRHAPD